MTVGWIGLGRMGRPMCENLVRKGFDVVVQNRSQAKVGELVAMGATAGGTFAEMAASVDSIHVCLPDAATLDAVMLAPDGVLAGAGPSPNRGSTLVIVDHSTTAPEQTQRLAALAVERGAAYVDAPVSGAGAIAERGELTIMAGGDEPAFEAVRPALEAMGSTVRLMGPSGSGNLAKLINGLIMTTTLAVSFEGLALAAKLGLDAQSLFEIVRTASGASRAWERNVPRILSGNYGNDGAVRLIVKDDDLVHTLATDAGVSLPVLEAARAVWHEASAMGLDEVDISSAVKVAEHAMGVRLASD
jgi:3-hydroxyisobutyrate dehydrogenase-like beta-hydroxyacid dehydrogenase